MKEIIIFSLTILLSSIINNFIYGFLFDNLKNFSDIIQTREKPKIIFINDNNNVLAGESLFISCISTGDPVPDIQWYIDRNPIIRVTKSTSESINRYHNRYLSMNFKSKRIVKSTLIYKRILTEDSKYLLSCESENVLGTDTKTIRIKVFDKRSNLLFPYVAIEDTSKTKLKRNNSAAVIQCDHKNSPNAKVYWFKDFEYISSPEYIITNNRRQSKLSINNIMGKDEGVYQCFVINHIGGQLSKPMQIVISDIPQPTINVTIIEQTSTSARICWKLAIYNSTIEEFILYYETNSQIESISILTDKSSKNLNDYECYLLKKLLPFTEYKTWIISSNSLGKSEIGKTIKFNTSEDLPFGPPTSITASAISNTAVEVRWKPVENINGILKTYTLLYTEHPDLPNQHWRHYNTKFESSLLSHLTPNKIHHITIQAVNGVGKGPLSKPVAILTKSGTISECPEFRATKILLNSITLEWEEPDPNNIQNCLGLKLEIFYTSQSYASENKIVNINTNQYSYEIQNAKEDTEILFILRAYNQVGFGMPVKLSILTAGKAKINKNVVYIIDSTSFTIIARWRQPNKDAINMKLQLLGINGKLYSLIRYLNLPTTRSEFKIDEWNIFNFTRLIPSQKYQVKLTFLSRENAKTIRESFYLSNIMETKKSHPESVGFFNLNIEKNSNSHLLLNAVWEDLPNFENSKSPTIYQIKYRIISPNELSTDFKLFYTNLTSYSFNFTNIPVFGVTYELVLSRFGNLNQELNAKRIVNMPEEKPIKSPFDIKVVSMSESSVTITWKNPPIKYTNGKIVTNEVELKPINKIFNTTKTLITIPNLQYRSYKTRIRSCTRVGCGPWSHYFEFSFHDVDVSPPQDVKAFRILDSKIKVEWKIGYDQNLNPYMFSKDILGYVLYYSPRDTLNATSPWKQIKIYENISSYEIKNIEKNVFYIVKMSSIDQYNRTGKWSEPAVPENVDLSIYSIKTFSNLQCNYITTNSIEIRADYPADTKYLNNILVSYSGQNVYWSVAEPEKISFIPVKELLLEYNRKESYLKLILKDLQINTKYSIRIIPNYSIDSKFGSNITLSTNILCSTKPIAPKVILPPKIVGTSTFYITLRLMRAEENYGKIDEYYLLVIPYQSKSKVLYQEFNKSPNDFSFMELKANLNKNIYPFIALRKTTVDLFNRQTYSDFLIRYKTNKTANPNKLFDEPFYRSALRACIQVEGGYSLCNTSPWSESFQLHFNIVEEPKGLIRKNTETTVKTKFNEQTIITLSLTLSGIFLALVCIIIGCVVHKRKSPHKKWESTCRSSAPEILQDAQMTPLVDMSSPKLDQKTYHLRTDQNFSFDTNTEVSNYKSYMNNNINMNHFDSPIQKKSKLFTNHQDTTPDIVNVSDGFNFFNTDSTQVSSNIASSKHTIPIDKLSEYVDELKNYDSLNLMQEFEELNKETFDKYASINSNLPNNKLKNRYANVVAYDHSIVPLQNQLDRDNCNYINANYIDGYVKQNEYIATQGPLPETINDFWQMIWEQRTSIIIMLVRIEESESKKCEIYWPKKGTRIYYDIEVTLLSSINRAHYIIRKFQLKQNGFANKRQVYQLQFTGWADQGIPILCVPFISFLKIYKKFNKLDTGPTVVHCSAGVGRTGVFIVVDSQMEKMKHEKMINVYDQIKNIRKQRNYMVQTEAQYGFIYDVILEWSQETNSEINPDMLISHIKTKSQIIENTALTGFEIEFQKLNLQSTNINANMSRIHGHATVNKQKNNSPHLIPFDWNRITLSSLSGVDGSDYINASFIDSYLTTKAYIVSQDPMASTVEDFWRLVWDQNCSIIVALGKLEELVKELSLPYWPIQKSIRYQFFVVDPMVEYNMSNYIMREFKVTDARDGEFKTIRQFHYSKWSNNVCPCDAHSFLEFIHQVQLTKENFGHGNPLLVHCSYGTGKSGIFIAINNILEKLKQESLIDVYSTVKLLQQQRVGLVQTVDQYKFCYLSILTHLIDINPDLKAQFCGFKDYINTSSLK